jgi:uncharacterized membrane protein YphA (DoxX/SURF4 family)
LRIAFRCAFAYFVLYNIPFPLSFIPYLNKTDEWWNALWQKLVPWVGQHLLHLATPITVFTNGSGDTRFDYVKNLCMVVLALGATILWSALDRRRPSYRQLQEWLRLYVRLTLGVTLLSYGAYKVIPSQFPAPGLWRYIQSYGDSSPMGLLWTFMGASKTYTIFAGAVEMIGGALLFVPRLTVLGALVAIGAMGNVFVLNMSYDVPVKLYSFNLLLMAVLVILPDLRRLANFFIFNRSAEPATPLPLFQRRWMNRTLLGLQLALGVFFIGLCLYQSYQSFKSFKDFSAKPPLYGMWAVDEFTLNGQVRPPLLTDEVRWQKADFEFSAGFAYQGMDGKLQRFRAKIDAAKKTISLTKRDDAKWKADLTFNHPVPDQMTVEGQYDGQKLAVKLHRSDSKYLLNTRGFHWINESPFNR